MAKTTKSPKKTAKTAKTSAATTDAKPAQAAKATVVEAPVTSTASASARSSKRSVKLSFGDRLKAGLRASSPSRILAEFIGTFVLSSVVLAILGGKFSPLTYYVSQNLIEQQLEVTGGQSVTVALDQLLQQNGLIPYTALAVLVAVTYTILTLVLGRISGAHLNPAITIARMTQRTTRLSEGAFYVVAQLLAGLLAFAVVSSVAGVMGDNLFLHRADWSMFYGEALGAFVFGFGVASAALYARGLGKQAVIVGGSYLAGAIVASIGGSRGLLNPALAVAVQAFSIDNTAWRTMLIVTYVGAPLLGAIVGFAAYRLISREARRDSSLRFER